MSRVLFWILVIPGGIITYLVIGVLVYLASCKIDGTNWRRDVTSGNSLAGILLMWPIFLILVIVALPVCVVIRVIEMIAEGENGKRK